MFTKSKCNYCTRAKKLVPHAKSVLCDDILRTKRDLFLTAIQHESGREHRTFPMVFHNGKFVGGFNELQEYVDKEQAFNFCDF